MTGTAQISHKKRILTFLPAFVAVSLLVLLALPIMKSRPDSIAWEKDYDTALERSKSEKKPIIADMYTDWCSWCKKLDRDTFANPALIQKMAEQYVWLKLNTETEEDGIRLQKAFHIVSYPTILILDADGQEIDRIDGYLPADKFQQAIEHYIRSSDSLGKIRAKAELQPDAVKAHFVLARKYLERKEYDKAEAVFRRIIKLDPENKQGRTDLSGYFLALSLASQEKPTEALKQLTFLDTQFPESRLIPDSAVLQGQILYYSGNNAAAQKIFRAYLKKYPEHGFANDVKRLLAEMDQG